MAFEIHRLDGEDGPLYRIWYTVVDAYITDELNEDELRGALIRRGVQRTVGDYLWEMSHLISQAELLDEWDESPPVTGNRAHIADGNDISVALTTDADGVMTLTTIITPLKKEGGRYVLLKNRETGSGLFAWERSNRNWLRKLSALAITLLYSTFYVMYAREVAKGPEVTEPLMLQWICFGVASTLALLTWATTRNEGKDVIGNIQSLLDLAIYVVPAVMLYYGNYSLELNGVTIVAGTLSVVALAYWAQNWRKNSRNANLVCQFIIFLGFIPAYYRMLVEGVNKEALFPWLIVLCSTSLGLYGAYTGRERLPKIYTARAWSCVLLNVCFMAAVNSGEVWLARLIFFFALFVLWKLRFKVRELLVEQDEVLA